MTEQQVEKFTANMRGSVLRPGETGFDAARTVWNGMIDRSPALIARCAGAADVISAVNLARDRDLLLAVRGGGHSAAGSGVCDGGLMLDLSPMKGIRVDPARRIARAEAGLTWAEFDRETQAFGLATHRRSRVYHRYLRTDPGWRYRLAVARPRAELRQPAVR